MNRITQSLSLIILVSCSAFAVQGQTSSELRARYGEPQKIELENDRVVLERFLVRPDIQMTIRYTKSGEPCEALLEPVPNSTPKPDPALDRDLMSTIAVIELINEILPEAKRGKRVSAFRVNGGDPEMKLHHFGCTGVDLVNYENARISVVSWCKGGTFSATIRWGQIECPIKR